VLGLIQAFNWIVESKWWVGYSQITRQFFGSPRLFAVHEERRAGRDKIGTGWSLFGSHGSMPKGIAENSST